MYIRRAEQKDMTRINNLLRQGLMVHHNGRPDIFKPNAKKYTDAELMDILADDSKPVFVAVDETDTVLGYAFCVFQQHLNNNILTDIKTLYIDDLCVDKEHRGEHIGTVIYGAVCEYAKDIGCDSITLNVWEGNDSARAFYDALGFTPRSTTMEVKL